MTYKHIALWDFVADSVHYGESAFKSALQNMLDSAQQDNSEEFQKNLIAQFLRTNFDYECNVRGKADLAIYDEGIAKVLFEVKSTQNKAEFVKSPNLSSLRWSEANAAIHKIDGYFASLVNPVDCHESLRDSRNPNPSRKGRGLKTPKIPPSLACGNFKDSPSLAEGVRGWVDSHNDAWSLESKAFYESILYFLREFHQKKNNNIKHIILCTAREFYIIKAQTYHALFIANADKAIQKAIDTAYKNCDLNQGNDTSTGKFYAEIESILREMSDTLEFCYINIQTLLDSLDLCESTKDLSLFYALLSQNSLLQIPRYIDANTLNEKFYKELLYLLGLQQIETNGKVLLKPDSTPNTLLDLLQSTFADKLPSDIDEAFESHIFPLLMLWNNRILFLRLLESMLLNFKHIEKPFLHIEVLSDFSALSTLFFKVLAVKEREVIPQNLANIPYLNSSLFEKSALESQGFEIALLESKPLKIAPDSILRRDSAQNAIYKSVNELPFLEYLFTFLHAYNFTTTPKDIVDFTKTNHDKLINSAVLGLVFEKLNGYKEGSFFTPSFITSYMCAQSIRKVVLEKFQSHGYKAQNLTALRNEIDINKLNEANKIFLSIHICDPAVGSGHFLVSALNELIAIKHELGLLLDCDGKRLRDIDLALENDELIIKDSSGKIIDYTIPAHERIESHIIQKAIFYTKREIIEHCLFGVDINPSSVEICKLRLWIELLKYSYYENIATREIQTLPNIDINIKCGNSLISRFKLDDSLPTTQNIKNQISDYKKLVFDYKNADQNISTTKKSDIVAKIHAIKQTFRLTLKDPKTKRELENAIKKHTALYGLFMLDNESLLDGLDSGISNTFISANLSEAEQKDAVTSFANIKFLRHKLDSNGNGYKNAFEWRFEFPEVLDENGDFMGFDLVIGNPPYIRQEEIKELKPHLQKAFGIFTSTADIYTYFYEQGLKLLKARGILSLITSNKFCRAGYGANLREFLTQSEILDFVDLNGIKVFDKATVDTCIVNLRKAKPIKSHTINYFNPKDKNLSNPTYTQIAQDLLNSKAFIFADSHTRNLKAKIEKIGTSLKEWDIAINYGIKTGYNEAFIIDAATKEAILDSCESSAERKRTEQIIKPILRGQDIKRYSYEWANLWLINTHNGYIAQNGDKIPPIKIAKYPALKAYFDGQIKDTRKKGKGLFDRADKGVTPYNLRNCAYLEKFENEKIVYKQIMAKGAEFCLDRQKFFTDTTATIITGANLKYILGLLNSKIAYFAMRTFYMGGGIEGEFKVNNLEKFPIPKITAKNQKIADKIINLVDKILESKSQGKDTSALESQIDDLVYKLYELDSHEIEIIKS